MRLFKLPFSGSGKRELEALQERIEHIRARIQQKREQAQQSFQQLLEAIEKTRGIEGLEHLAGQLEELGKIFTKGSETLAKQPEDEIIAFEKSEAEIALEDILMAMQTLALSKDQETKLTALLLKERLKEMMFAQFAERGKHPPDWSKAVTTNDLIALLQKAEIRTAIGEFESPLAFLEQSIAIAEESVGLQKSGTMKHAGATDERGLNTKQPNQTLGKN